jgi:hypothetical protein
MGDEQKPQPGEREEPTPERPGEEREPNVPDEGGGLPGDPGVDWE